MDEQQQQRESSTAQVSFKEAELEALRTRLINLEQELREAQQKLNSTNDKIRKQEEDILVSRERMRSLEKTNERIEQDIQQLQKRVLDVKKTIKQRTEALAVADDKLKVAEATFQKEKAELDEIEKLFRQKQEQGKQYAAAMRRYLEQISGYQGNIEHFKAKVTFLEGRIGELKTEQEKTLQQKQKLETELDEKKKHEQAINNTIREQSDACESINNEITTTVQAIEDIREQINNGKTACDTLEQRISIVRKLLENYEDYPEGVKHILLQKKGYAGTLADVMSVPTEYRHALETVLGEAATYMIVDTPEQAFLEIRELSSNQKGVVTFLPLERLSAPSNSKADISALPNEDDVIGWADELIQCDTRYHSVLKSLLGDCLIVRNIEPFRQHNTLGATVVSLDGSMITPWGGIRGGKRKKDETSIIGRRDQLKQLTAQLDNARQQIEARDKQRAELERQLETHKTSLSEQESALEKTQRELGTVTMNISQLEYQLGQSQQREQAIRQELQQLNAQLESAQNDIQKATEELTGIREQHSVTDNDIASVNSELEELNQRRDVTAQKVHELQLSVVRLQNERSNMAAEIERGQRFIQESNDTIKAHYTELHENDRTRESLAEHIENLTEVLVVDYAEKEKEENIVQELEQQRQAIKDESDEKEQVVRALRKERENYAEIIHGMELRIAELKMQADNLYRRIGEEYNTDLQRIDMDSEYDIQKDEEEIESLRQRIKNLGPVNLLALKEYEAEKERYDFLKNQQTDLIEAKQNLTETIAQINRTAQEKFNEVFSRVRKNFSYVFQKFFPEGEADLVLSETEDPLEASIDIIANPKGKRPTALTLLSGGEKALTAISLLFAIYLVKPSPFCILDEVDAPLDDRNIQRFTSTLKDFSETTQFLIVTHNKLTMKAADCLYGITMETPGISKVVSVKME